MNFQYRFTLPVPVDQAWATLLDVRRVAPCMPGAGIESGEGDHYVGRVKVKLGPIEMAYRGDLHFIERDEAAHRMKLEGVGKEMRGGGGAKALVTMHVASVPGGSEVAIDSEYELSGRAAQFGTGMIDEIGGKLMKEFARRLEKLILGGHNQASGQSSSMSQARASERALLQATPVATGTAVATGLTRRVPRMRAWLFFRADWPEASRSVSWASSSDARPSPAWLPRPRGPRSP